MRLGRHVDDGIGGILAQHRAQTQVGDIEMDEVIAWIAGDIGQIRWIASISELIPFVTRATGRASNIRTRWLPMKPAPPVTRM